MSIIKFIQESDLIKNRSLFQMKTTEKHIENLKEMVKEKDVIITSDKDKIKELEDHISALNRTLQETKSTHALEIRKIGREKINVGIIYKYEKFLNQISAEFEVMREERNAATQHLACIEEGFADLLNKYERLKTIVIGYQENQEILIDHFNKHQETINMVQKKYEDLKEYTNEKLDESNKYLEKVRKKHVCEIAKIKTEVLPSQVKICELEKTIANLKENTSGTYIG